LIKATRIRPFFEQYGHLLLHISVRICLIPLSAEGKELSVEFIRVPYDVEQAAQAIEATEMPDEFAEMLRLGKG
jgi:hypothetical protein